MMKSLKISPFKEKFFLFIASFFFIGFLPFCPGTFGALAGAVFFWIFLKPFSVKYQFFFSVLLFFVGVWASFEVSKLFKREDPDEVVIDEVVGMWIALLGRHTFFEFLLAFGLFRLFDIKKPLFIARVEKIPKGWGIMLDDVLAGIYSAIFLYLILHLRGFLPFVKM